MIPAIPRCTLKDVRLFEQPNEIWTLDEYGHGDRLLTRTYEEQPFYECAGPSHPGDIVEFASWEEVQGHLTHVQNELDRYVQKLAKKEV